jgi:hypothetical protein
MRRVEVAVIWVIVAGAATYLFLVNPARGVGYPTCPFRMLTGLQCPGCGSTRALHQLLHGHPLAAFELNPLLVIAVPFFALVLLLFTQQAIFGSSYFTKLNSAVPRKFGWVMLAVIVCFWIVRNTSLYPFIS